MLNDWEVQFPGRIESMFTAIRNVAPSHLSDGSLFDFKGISTNDGITAEMKEGGDTAFDQEIFTEVKTDTASAEQTLNIIEVL